MSFIPQRHVSSNIQLWKLQPRQKWGCSIKRYLTWSKIIQIQPLWHSLIISIWYLIQYWWHSFQMVFDGRHKRIFIPCYSSLSEATSHLCDWKWPFTSSRLHVRGAILQHEQALNSIFNLVREMVNLKFFHFKDLSSCCPEQPHLSCCTMKL